MWQIPGHRRAAVRDRRRPGARRAAGAAPRPLPGRRPEAVDLRLTQRRPRRLRRPPTPRPGGRRRGPAAGRELPLLSGYPGRGEARRRAGDARRPWRPAVPAATALRPAGRRPGVRNAGAGQGGGLRRSAALRRRALGRLAPGDDEASGAGTSRPTLRGRNRSPGLRHPPPLRRPRRPLGRRPRHPTRPREPSSPKRSSAPSTSITAPGFKLWFLRADRGHCGPRHPAAGRPARRQGAGPSAITAAAEGTEASETTEPASAKRTEPPNEPSPDDGAPRPAKQITLFDLD